MNIINEIVNHKAWGQGKILSLEGSIIEVEFSIGNKKLQFPEGFEKFLTFNNSELQTYTLKLLEEKRKLEEECVNEISITNYDIENDKYNSEIQKIDSEKNEPSFHLIKRHYTNKKIDILKKEIHILALKACQEIDDDIILRISDFIEMPKEVLLNQINNLRIKSNEKLIKHNNLIYRRNRAYFYKRRYNLELSKLLPESALYESIKYLKCYISQG